MITATGYSKDASIIPEGIAITWGVDYVAEHSIEAQKRLFEQTCRKEGHMWLQRCRNKPKYDVAYVYIIYNGLVIYRCQYAGHDAGETTITKPGGTKHVISWPRIVCTGPAIKAPFEINRKGFRGFRYTTKLF